MMGGWHRRGRFARLWRGSGLVATEEGWMNSAFWKY